MKKHIITIFTILLALPLAFGALHASSDPSTMRLMVQSDLVYKGAFRLPNGQYGGSAFNYGGAAMAYNAANNSLFMLGRDKEQMVAEVNIPTPVNSSNLNDLPFATVLQPFVEPTEGKWHDAEVIGTSLKTGGLLVSGTRLIGAMYTFYDANNKQTLSHFARPLNLSDTGHVQGMYQVSAPGNASVTPSTLKAGFFSGYLAPIPVVWQALLGGPAMTGQCCISISSRTSNGPGVFAFNPADVGTKTPIPAVPLTYYPQSNPLALWDSTNPTYNGTTKMAGLVVPEGARTALYFGMTGVGSYCYGNGGLTPQAGANASFCYDPQNNAHGGHAYPYVHRAWAYDLNEFAKVKSGAKQPWDVKPYQLWTFDLPFDKPGHLLAGVAYDPGGGRIYLSQAGGDGEIPVIHVYGVEFCSLCPREATVTR